MSVNTKSLLSEKPSGHLGFNLLCLFFLMLFRFGKKKEDKNKDAAKTSKNKLEALSEEELDRMPDSRDGYESNMYRICLCVGFSQVKVSKERKRFTTQECSCNCNRRKVFQCSKVLWLTPYLTSCESFWCSNMHPPDPPKRALSGMCSTAVCHNTY